MIVSQPVVAEAAPVVPVAAPAPVTQTQYHAQDELGQYNFGYSDPNSARTETKVGSRLIERDK